MPIGARLKALRTARGLSQQDVAMAGGLSLSIVSQLEQGKTDDPKLSTLKAIAAGLGVTLDELTGDGRAAGEPVAAVKRKKK
jgi:transcriptional regulator with XRE-family HTH domain